MPDIVQERVSQETESASRLYQVLLLTPDGHVAQTERIAARNDNQALRLARSMVNGHAVDLWDGLRFIEHFLTEGSYPVERP